MLKHILNRIRNIRGKQSSRDWNLIIDQAIKVASVEALTDFCRVESVNYTEQAYWNWVKLSHSPFAKKRYPDKKALEFFFSAQVLDVQPFDHLLDAAGGHSGYIDTVRHTTGCQHLYLTDHVYEGVHRDPEGNTIAGGDISDIALPDESIDRIACHHAFEHFKDEKDIFFIQEIGRLLRPNGRACIIPIFLVNRYAECWNIDHSGVFDENAELIIDKTASLPGADVDGHFARLYNTDAFRRRIINNAEAACLTPKIVTCRLDDNDLPDMKKNFGSKLNFPLRALVLEKRKKRAH
ncbi:methyltransferase domain-containing protein [Thermodesulfobacteriota bacterium]